MEASLQSCLSLRSSLFPQQTNAYRVVHRKELPGYDIAFDRYGDWGCLWVYEEIPYGNDSITRYQGIISFIQKELSLKGVVVKAPQRNPHNNRLVDFQTTVGEAPPAHFTVYEDDLFYNVTLTESQHIGLFLDQRDNRKKVKEKAYGKRVLNLFSYTCSFSVAAASANCEVVFSVDVAGPCLQIGKDNFETNSLAEKQVGKFIKEDVRTWLKKQLRKKDKGNLVPFDIIVCDPPVFAKSKKEGNFSVEKEWDFLADACSQVLSDDGFAFFSNNHRKGVDKKYFQELRKYFKHVEPISPSLDFPELEHLKGYEKHVRMYFCKKPIR